MTSALKWRYCIRRARPHRRNLELIEGVPRGMGRAYTDAERLGLTDPAIRELVAAMNRVDLVATLASCEGHGGWGRYASPYVLFRSRVQWAAQLNARLEADAVSENPTLNYEWRVIGVFDADHRVIFRRAIPGIRRYRWVTRHRLNQDFSRVRALCQSIGEPAC
ncbi:MAG: hypothetical protein VB138_02640 [Burkholderia sp.]